MIEEFKARKKGESKVIDEPQQEVQEAPNI
jgi:hypothetical protein